MYDRYLATQLARPMLAILGAALLVLLAERLLRVVDIVVGWRGSLVVIVEILGYLVPSYMGLALPGALFIAILLTVGRLSRDGELDAMLASGLGFPDVLRPLLATGAVLAVANFAVQSHLQPWSRYAYRASIHALSNVTFQVLLKDGQFVTLNESTYLVRGIAADRSTFDGLFLATERADGGVLATTAEAGEILPAREGGPTTLLLRDGLQQLTPPSGAPPERRSTTVRFRDFTTDLAGSEPEPLAPRGADERELTLPELLENPGGFPEREIQPPEVAAELHVRLVRVAATLVLPLVAAPLALARRRSRRSYGFVLGVALLLLFNQVVQFGKTLADDDVLPVALGLWAPLLLFAALGGFLSWDRSARVPSGSATGLERALDRWGDRLRGRSPESGAGAGARA